MLVGNPPFFDPNPYRVYKKIIKGDYETPSDISDTAKELISRLLNQNQQERLGSLNGCEEVRNMG